MSLLDDLIENIRRADGNTDAKIDEEFQSKAFESMSSLDRSTKAFEAKASALQNATGMAEAIETYVKGYLKTFDIE